MQRTITISASATVDAEPDQARITSGVVSEAATAREALAKNTDAMNAVVGNIKSKGIDPKDVQTSAFNIQPVFDYSDKVRQEQKIVGYRVSNEVSVLVRDISKVGNILDEVVASGANQVNGLEFEVSKAEVLKDRARERAVANAERRARLLAKASKAELGNVLQISEETVSSGPRPYAARTMAMGAGKAAPIESGSVALEARVTMIWELK